MKGQIGEWTDQWVDALMQEREVQGDFSRRVRVHCVRVNLSGGEVVLECKGEPCLRLMVDSFGGQC